MYIFNVICIIMFMHHSAIDIQQATTCVTYVLTLSPIGFSMPRPLNGVTSTSWQNNWCPLLSAPLFGLHHWHTNKCDNWASGVRIYQANQTKPKPLYDH